MAGMVNRWLALALMLGCGGTEAPTAETPDVPQEPVVDVPNPEPSSADSGMYLATEGLVQLWHAAGRSKWTYTLGLEQAVLRTSSPETLAQARGHVKVDGRTFAVTEPAALSEAATAALQPVVAVDGDGRTLYMVFDLQSVGPLSSPLSTVGAQAESDLIGTLQVDTWAIQMTARGRWTRTASGLSVAFAEPISLNLDALGLKETSDAVIDAFDASGAGTMMVAAEISFEQVPETTEVPRFFRIPRTVQTVTTIVEKVDAINDDYEVYVEQVSGRYDPDGSSTPVNRKMYEGMKEVTKRRRKKKTLQLE